MGAAGRSAVIKLQYHHHGHAGPRRSPVPEREISISDLADDVIAVADHLGVEKFSYCGLSIGGVIGQSLAARYANRINCVVLASTGLTILSRDGLYARAQKVIDEGMNWIADLSESRWFTEEFRQRDPEAVRKKMDTLRNMDPRGYAAACIALANFDGTELAAAITRPSLVVMGEEDVATPVVGGQKLAELIAARSTRAFRTPRTSAIWNSPSYSTPLCSSTFPHLEANECPTNSKAK
ncbi:alpha/beta fold hydrolase [Devosia sp. A449]